MEDYRCDDEDEMPKIGAFQALLFLVMLMFWDHWRTIIGTALIIGAVCVETILFNFAWAKLVVALCTATAALISLIIVDLSLENQNCHAQTAYELWRSRAGYKVHIILASVSVILVGLGAYVADHLPGTSVYWPAVVATLIVCPAIILAIAYLRVGSTLYIRYSSR